MKNKLFNLLLTPNLWIGTFCALAVVGIICLSLGYRKIGLYVLAPLLVGGLISVLVLIPILIRANRKQRDRSENDEPRNRV